MLSSLIRLARPVQWIKNSVLLAALVFAAEADNPDKLLFAMLGFAVFCLLSSGVYTFNDLIDIKKDKQHPLKKKRPLASGEISSKAAIILLSFLFLTGLILAWWVNVNFLLVSFSFIMLNIIYTLWLKNIVIVDVMSIAMSFVIRAYAGAIIIDVPASKWMLLNTLFLALFLGFGKRRHELIYLEDDAVGHRKILGRYSPYLLDQFIGVVTGAVVVMYMLYTFSAEVSQKLGTENLYVTIPFVVYGIFRYLYLIHKEEQGGSPTSVLINDKPILFTVLLWLVTVILIMYVL